MTGYRFARGLLTGVVLSIIVLIGALFLFNNLSVESNDTPATGTLSPSLTAAATHSLHSLTTTPELSSQRPNERTIQRLVDEVLNDGNTEVLSEIFAPGYMGHLPASETTWPSLTVESYNELAILLRNAIPDIRVIPEIVISDGEWVAMRAVLQGTFESEFYDLSPTRQPINLVFTILYRFNDEGKIVEEWLEYDTLAFAQQFGVVPCKSD